MGFGYKALKRRGEKRQPKHNVIEKRAETTKHPRRARETNGWLLRIKG